MSSVIPALTMSEVRRCLQEIRKAWDTQTPWKAFDSSRKLAALGHDMTIMQFAWMFVAGHHAQRKRQRSERRSTV